MNAVLHSLAAIMHKLSPAHMDYAAAAAAALVMDSMTRDANCPTASDRSLPAAIAPAVGVGWNRNVIAVITADSINKLMMMLRNSPLPRHRYDKLKDMFKTAFADVNSLLPEWAEWKQSDEVFMLDRRFSWGSIAKTISFLSARQSTDPGSLKALDSGAVESLAVLAPGAPPLRPLWRVALTVSAAVSPNDHLLLPENGMTSQVPKRAIKRSIWTIEKRNPGRPLIRKQLLAQASFARMGLSRRIRALRRLKSTPARANRVIQENPQLNLIKQVRGSLPSINSALNCYRQFAQLRNEPPSPSTERRVLDWSAVSNDTATFPQLHVSPAEGMLLLGHLYGLVCPGCQTCREGPYHGPWQELPIYEIIRSRPPLRIIAHESLRSEFAHAFLLSFLFSFRVPSETMQLRRAYRNDRMYEFFPHPENAVLGVRQVGGADFLVMKLSFRKNISRGVILKRPCFRGLGSRTARSSCPVHALWPAIKSRDVPCHLLFNQVNRRNFNRILKAFLTKLAALRLRAIGRTPSVAVQRKS